MTWYAIDLMVELLPRTMDAILSEHFPRVKALYEAIVTRPRIKAWLETAALPPKDRSDLEGVDAANVRARNWLILTDRTDLAGVEAVAARDRAGDIKFDVQFASMRRTIQLR